MATFLQLARKGRIHKRRRNAVAALLGGPQRKAVVMRMMTTNPRKPNSAKRKYARVRIVISDRVVNAHIPGIGPSFIQEYSVVMIEGGNPPDTPGVNYSLIRGVYDFDSSEQYGRMKRRSKFGCKRPTFEKHKHKSPEQLIEEGWGLGKFAKNR